MNVKKRELPRNKRTGLAEIAGSRNEREDKTGDLQRLQFVCDPVAKAVDKDGKELERTLKFVISTKSVDRHGDTVNPKGWELEPYRKNPVVLFGHDYGSPPVAKATSVELVKNKLVSEAEFPEEGMYPFADMIYNMYLNGFMRATSVGFRALKWQFAIPDEKLEEYFEDPDSFERGPSDIDFIQQELMEYSAVPVPANPEALIAAKRYGIDPTPLKDWAEQTLDMWQVHERSGLEVPRDRVEQLYKAVQDVVGTNTAGAGAEDADKDEDAPTKEEFIARLYAYLTGEEETEDYEALVEEAKGYEGVVVPKEAHFQHLTLNEFPEHFQFDWDTGAVVLTTPETKDDGGTDTEGSEGGDNEEKKEKETGGDNAEDKDENSEEKDAEDESEQFSMETFKSLLNEAVAAATKAMEESIMDEVSKLSKRIDGLEEAANDGEELSATEIAEMVQKKVATTLAQRTGRTA